MKRLADVFCHSEQIMNFIKEYLNSRLNEKVITLIIDFINLFFYKCSELDNEMRSNYYKENIELIKNTEFKLKLESVYNKCKSQKIIDILLEILNE